VPYRPDRHGTRRASQIGFAVLVLALIAELGGFGWRSAQLGHTRTVTVATAVSSPPVSRATTTTATTSTTTTSTSTATATTPRAISAAVSAPGSVTYTVAAGTTVKVTATGPCWMEARPRQGGPVTLQTTLKVGQSEMFTAPVWIRFGNPTLIQATAGTTRLHLAADAPSDLILQT
jgi:cytoskeletal protein RodZ